ncbi:MAG: hypothetical protein RLZZ447_1611 [Verrucomicrobiota bacterium]|jgi:hypothetical protein
MAPTVRAAAGSDLGWLGVWGLMLRGEAIDVGRAA